MILVANFKLILIICKTIYNSSFSRNFIEIRVKYCRGNDGDTGDNVQSGSIWNLQNCLQYKIINYKL